MIIILDVGVDTTTPVAKESSSEEEMPVVLPAAQGTKAAHEERWARKKNANSDDEGVGGRGLDPLSDEVEH